jgi:hypothetical protein
VSEREKVGINWVQVFSAALAAVSSTVLLSTLGVAGTLIGAAVGSFIASVGGALYSRGLAASHQRVAVQAAALRRAAQARSHGPQGTAVMEPVVEPVLDTHADPADAPTEGAAMADGAGGLPPEEATDEEPDALFHAEPGKPLPWKRIALVAAALFVAVMVAVTAFELLTGKPVSAYTGGSSDSGTTLFERHKDTPTPTPTPSQSPSDSATSSSSTPSESPTVLPSGTASPTQEPTGTPTTGTSSATPSGSPSATPGTTPGTTQ